MTNKKIEKIYDSLDHPWYYARDAKSVECETGISGQEILELIKGEPINRFVFDGVEYIGLDSRKYEYDKDAKLGINPFEPNYKGDNYRNEVLGGKPRFN